MRLEPFTPLLAGLFALPALATVTPPVSGGHLAWLHADAAWYTATGVVDANGDGVDDPVVAAGDRTAPYNGCLVPPAAPTPQLHSLQDQVLVPAAKLAVLDGVDGEPLWEVAFADRQLGVDRERLEVVQTVETDDLDGDGQQDLLVLHQSHAADGSDIQQLVTMYDPTTGDVRWQLEHTVPGGTLAAQTFQPLELFGEPGGVLGHVTFMIDGGSSPSMTMEIDARLVHLRPDGPPTTFFELPDDQAGRLVPYGDGYRMLTFPTRIEGAPPVVHIDAKAVDVVLDDQGEPVLREAWVRPGAGGSPVHVAEGDDPAVIIGRVVGPDNRANVVAMNLSDGQDRWTSPVDAGPAGGTFLTVDATGDGTDDVVASPAFGPDPTGALAGGLSPQLVALDGRDGSLLWSQIDPAGKYRAWVLDTADVTGNGAPEIVAALTSQDGFPLCSQPSDDAGVVAVYDLADGSTTCRFHTDRLPVVLGSGQLDGRGGDEVVAPTLGGNVYAFTQAEPGCGALAPGP